MTDLAMVDVDYRAIGPTELSVWEAEFARVDSPLLPFVREMHAVAGAHSALCLGMMWLENQYATTGILIRPEDYNPLSARPWRDDPTYKGGVYTSKLSLAEMLATYAPPGDVHPETGLDNMHIDYAGVVRKKLAEFAQMEGQKTPMNLAYGRVPMPGHVDLQHTTADKPEGKGWDNLGKRDVLGIALHRMYGTLTGTDQHFANPSVQSLTDYGIGTANIDGAKLDGVIHKYNDPLGYRSGWASGRVSAPYGDGAKFVAKYGINAVNRRLVSIETSGYDTDPFTEFAFGELVKLIAYYADQAKVPYTSLPLNPHTGINFIIWHEEFTIGTGKRCPFTWMKQNTPRLYTDVAAYLKPLQEGAAGKPEKPPVEPPVEKPTYAAPQPIKELAAVADSDHDTISAVVTREGDDFIFVGDRVEAIRDTPRLQYATPKAKHTGPAIKAGEQFDVDYMIKAADGDWYYITGWWTRVKAADTKRISDTPAGSKVA
jgi:hypothetical protein